MPQLHSNPTASSPIHHALPAPDRFAQSGYDPSVQLTHVHDMVSKGLKYLNLACTQMERVEQELDHFLKEYYAQVGGYFEELELIKREITHYERQIAQSNRRRTRVVDDTETRKMQEAVSELMQAMPQVPKALQDKDELEAERKAIYRRLAKLYHPDVVAPQTRNYAHEVLQLLNEAYEKRNLWAMREMEHSLVEHAHAQDALPTKLTRLRERFDAIAATITRVTERRKCLQASAAWQLKERMAQDRYLVEVVIHRAKTQIDEARHVLFRKKLEYQAVNA